MEKEYSFVSCKHRVWCYKEVGGPEHLSGIVDYRVTMLPIMKQSELKRVLEPLTTKE